MKLCTVTNEKYIKSCINLLKSYGENSFGEMACVYFFGTDVQNLQEIRQHVNYQVELIEIPEVCPHAHIPSAFFYKVYAIRDALYNYGSIIYSDSTNCFIKKFINYDEVMPDGRLLLPYTSPHLTNKFWSTKQSLEKMEALDASFMPQYWAGFQAYKNTEFNLKFVDEMYEYALDPDICLPTTQVKKPDGPEQPCIEHRQDQTILSALIHKHYIHEMYDPVKQQMFGDWQTFKNFDSNYQIQQEMIVLSARESKFGRYRFLNT